MAGLAGGLPRAHNQRGTCSRVCAEALMLAAASPDPATTCAALPLLQVPHNGAHVSCCAVVRGMQRNLFAVPRTPVGSEEIAALDAAAAGGDAEAKRKLIPLLHVRWAYSGHDCGLQNYGSCSCRARLIMCPLFCPNVISLFVLHNPSNPDTTPAASVCRREGRGARAAGQARREPADHEAGGAAVRV